MASSRKKDNRVVKLKNNDGVWVDGQENLCSMVLDYFRDLFATPVNTSNIDLFLEGVNILISPEQNNDLTSD